MFPSSAREPPAATCEPFALVHFLRWTAMRCSTYPARPPADVKFAGFRKNGHPRAADTAPNAMNARRPSVLQFGRFIDIPDSVPSRYPLASDARRYRLRPTGSPPSAARPRNARPKKQDGLDRAHASSDSGGPHLGPCPGCFSGSATLTSIWRRGTTPSFSPRWWVSSRRDHRGNPHRPGFGCG